MYKQIKLLMAVVAIVMVLVLGKSLANQVSNVEVASDQAKKEEILVIIDPGHGGKDPGKVGCNHALEKDLNLKIAKKLEKILAKNHISMIMTRGTDEGLNKPTSSNKKIEDMKNRVALINKTKPRLVVSIHQNSYSESSIHGAQVFYFTHSKDGEVAANIMQEKLLAIDQGNTRKAKANDTYYLLKKTEVPTIIVEAGFLSNQDEAEKLVTDEYQKQIAEAICEGIKGYLSE